MKNLMCLVGFVSLVGVLGINALRVNAEMGCWDVVVGKPVCPKPSPSPSPTPSPSPSPTPTPTPTN